MTVQEFLEGAVSFDMNRVAHTIFWAIQEGRVKGDDDASRLLDLHLHDTAITWLTEQNVLGLERIKLFAVKGNTKEELYAFYFAETIEEVQQLHQALFKQRVERITNASRLMPKVMSFMKDGIDTSFFSYREKIVEFPVYIGHALSGQTTIFKLGGMQQ